MGKWTYRIGFLLCIVLVVGLIVGFFLFVKPPGGGWLLYPTEEDVGVLSGTVTIKWDPNKVQTNTVVIEWTNRRKCAETMAAEVCWQLWNNPDHPPTIIAEVPNTGEYQWDTTQYPNGDYNHIRITDPSGQHMDASDHPFAIQN